MYGYGLQKDDVSTVLSHKCVACCALIIAVCTLPISI